ncbi:phage tail assembly protein T [Citrobacter sp. FDAARGOS_156]|nr:phage tail assembly protein T [Citrobacter sp. FDAARGOS_156]
MNLAREFGRPDWRAMLAGMTSGELGDWHHFYRDHYFQDAQLDAHFSGLLYSISSLFFRDPELTPAHFSLLSPSGHSIDDEPDDEAMMSAAEGITGGIRYGPAD